MSGAVTGTIAGDTFDTYGLFGPSGGKLSEKALSAAQSYATSLAASYSARSTLDDYLGTGSLTLNVMIGGSTVARRASGTPRSSTQAGTDTIMTLAIGDTVPAPEPASLTALCADLAGGGCARRQ